jgi:glyoxalase/bleomycin resistance protein/dioxygenase superfamily protein
MLPGTGARSSHAPATQRGSDMTTTFVYAIKYVADMDSAVRFYCEQLGLEPRFESPHWSEFETCSLAWPEVGAKFKDSEGTQCSLSG